MNVWYRAVTVLCLAAVAGGAIAAEGETAYARWKNGPSADPSYFPIAVWLQSPSNAAKYKAAGINLFLGLWQGPTAAQLAELKAAGMPVICEQNALGLSRKDDKTIIGWMHGDEPDNAQPMKDPATGKDTYGPCIPPTKIVSEYEQQRAADPSRPVMLNLGQGVADDQWIGRGSGASLKDYETYVKGADIVSYDIYPVVGTGRPNSENELWLIAKGLDRLAKWTEGKKQIWNCIECTHISSPKKATPHQVRAEVWMSLIHGSKGLIYFVHEFQPKFNEHALLDDPEMLTAVTAINAQIRSLAPVLNSPTIADAAKADSSDANVPIDVMVKRSGGATYLFAVGMRNAPAHGTFAVKGVPANATVTVLGENRTLKAQSGRFEDDFKAYDVHLYRIAAR